MNEDKLQQLRAEHGEVYELEAGEHTIYVRMPTGPEFDRFQATAADQKMAARATAQLVRDVMLDPPKDEWAAIVAKRPGLPLAIGNAVLRLTGATLEVEAKKA